MCVCVFLFSPGFVFFFALPFQVHPITVCLCSSSFLAPHLTSSLPSPFHSSSHSSSSLPSSYTALVSFLFHGSLCFLLLPSSPLFPSVFTFFPLSTASCLRISHLSSLRMFLVPSSRLMRFSIFLFQSTGKRWKMEREGKKNCHENVQVFSSPRDAGIT